MYIILHGDTKQPFGSNYLKYVKLKSCTNLVLDTIPNNRIVTFKRYEDVKLNLDKLNEKTPNLYVIEEAIQI